jgi:hypothetical protein
MTCGGCINFRRRVSNTTEIVTEGSCAAAIPKWVDESDGAVSEYDDRECLCYANRGTI